MRTKSLLAGAALAIALSAVLAFSPSRQPDRAAAEPAITQSDPYTYGQC